MYNSKNEKKKKKKHLTKLGRPINSRKSSRCWLGWIEFVRLAG